MTLLEIEQELKKHVKAWNKKGRDHTKTAAYLTQSALNLRYAIQSGEKNGFNFKTEYDL